MSLINDALRKASKTQKSRGPQRPLGVPVQAVDSLKRPSRGFGGLLAPIVVLTVLGVSVWAFAVWWKARNPPVVAVVAAAPAGAPLTAAENSDEANALENTPISGEKSPIAAAAVSAQAAPKLPVAAPAPVPVAAPAAPPQQVSAAVLIPENSMPVLDAESEVARATPSQAPAPPPRVAAGAEAVSTEITVARTASIPYSVPTPSVKSSRAGDVVESAGRATDFVKLESSAKGTADAAPDSFPELNLQGIFFRLKNPSVMINRQALYVGDEIDGVSVVEIHRRKVVVEKDGRRKELSMGGY